MIKPTISAHSAESLLGKRIIASNKGLLPDMLKLKYEAMTESAFRFFRGTCELFYQDFSKWKEIPKSPLSWICGDLHVENFGSYKSGNGEVYFDLNDFDEALLAPVVWELCRMVTSILLCFDLLEIDELKARNMVEVFLKSYATVLLAGKALSIEPRVAKGIIKTFLTAVGKRKQSALLQKRTEEKKGKLVLCLAHERHFEVTPALRAELVEHLSDWITNHDRSPYNYKVRDVVFRLAGTGSIGTKRYLFLLENKNKKGSYLIVDMKQSQPSALTPFVAAAQPKWASESERVVFAQQLGQHMPCALLSSTIFKGEGYVMKEMQPAEDKIKFKLIQDQYRDIYQVIDDMATLTASSHLRSAGRKGSAIADELIAFAGRGDWAEKVANYAFVYANQVKSDFYHYKSAYEAGFFNSI